MGINLSKGQKFNLSKAPAAGGAAPAGITSFCVGVNWGAIQSTGSGGCFGDDGGTVDIDLDLSCIMMRNDGTFDGVYSPEYRADFLSQYGLPEGKLISKDGALTHSGDDKTGDTDGDDGLDNEVISVDLQRVSPDINRIYFFLNNVGQEDFQQIPFAAIRMYEGTPSMVKMIHATFNVNSDPAYSGCRAIVMGKLVRGAQGEWDFESIGQARRDNSLGETSRAIISGQV